MRTPWKHALLGLALAPAASSFCGFYVAQEPGSLFNESSKVVLVRDGDHTILTMANDYHGDPSEFGLVVPVPQEIKPSMVKIADRAVVDQLDQYTVPRLAEYWDPDPCTPPRPPEMDYDMAAPAMAGVMERQETKAGEAHGVHVEQAYKLDEYAITVISATTGRGLETWLTEQGYRLPDGAGPILESYIRQNMHFFLAKIDLSAQDRLGIRWPRPLRVEYDSPKFMLPIRLGTVNAHGPQDLLVFALTANGRVETTNYRTARLPTDVQLPEYIHDGGNFAKFYTAMFDRQVASDRMSAVYQEYAWPLTVSCDPCSADVLSGAQLQTLGATWASDYHGGMTGGFITRLHVRYDAEHFPEDLVFQETADTGTWQARYVVNHPFRGDTSCPAGRKYRTELSRRQEQEVTNLAGLTGWSPTDIWTWVR